VIIMLRILREPLVQFLLVGLALFGAWHIVRPADAARGPANRIVITEDDLKQIALGWVSQGRPPPTTQQLQSLIETKVREEVLYREALALGLDKDDTIVKRQLARKMDFLAEDLSKLEEPKPGEIRAWYDQHKARFALPPRASFRHVYFSPDRRRANAGRDAEAALRELGGQPIDVARAATAGDPFMFQSYYGDRAFDMIAREFGPPFARALLATKPGAWTGPIQSGYGWHLVFVESLTPGRVPEFDDIEPEVKAAWVEDRREVVRTRMYEDMRARYEVVLPEVKR
jgi:parvulin-like peptidyl-prolyl isomerase